MAVSNVLKELYIDLKTHLLSNAVETEFTTNSLKPIKRTDLYFGQYEDVIEYPSCLIEMADVVWSTRGKGLQRGELTVRFHLVQETYTQSHSNSVDEDEALKVLDTVEQLNTVLHHWKPENSTKLLRGRTTYHETPADYLIVHVLEFRCTVEQADIGRYRKLVNNNASDDPDGFDVRVLH